MAEYLLNLFGGAENDIFLLAFGGCAFFKSRVILSPENSNPNRLALSLARE